MNTSSIQSRNFVQNFEELNQRLDDIKILNESAEWKSQSTDLKIQKIPLDIEQRFNNKMDLFQQSYNQQMKHELQIKNENLQGKFSCLSKYDIQNDLNRAIYKHMMTLQLFKNIDFQKAQQKLTILETDYNLAQLKFASLREHDYNLQMTILDIKKDLDHQSFQAIVRQSFKASLFIDRLKSMFRQIQKFYREFRRQIHQLKVQLNKLSDQIAKKVRQYEDVQAPSLNIETEKEKSKSIHIKIQKLETNIRQVSFSQEQIQKFWKKMSILSEEVYEHKRQKIKEKREMMKLNAKKMERRTTDIQNQLTIAQSSLETRIVIAEQSGILNEKCYNEASINEAKLSEKVKELQLLLHQIDVPSIEVHQKRLHLLEKQIDQIKMKIQQR